MPGRLAAIWADERYPLSDRRQCRGRSQRAAGPRRARQRGQPRRSAPTSPSLKPRRSVRPSASRDAALDALCRPGGRRTGRRRRGDPAGGPVLRIARAGRRPSAAPGNPQAAASDLQGRPPLARATLPVPETIWLRRSATGASSRAAAEPTWSSRPAPRPRLGGPRRPRWTPRRYGRGLGEPLRAGQSRSSRWTSACSRSDRPRRRTS